METLLTSWVLKLRVRRTEMLRSDWQKRWQSTTTWPAETMPVIGKKGEDCLPLSWIQVKNEWILCVLRALDNCSHDMFCVLSGCKSIPRVLAFELGLNNDILTFSGLNWERSWTNWDWTSSEYGESTPSGERKKWEQQLRGFCSEGPSCWNNQESWKRNRKRKDKWKLRWGWQLLENFWRAENNWKGRKKRFVFHPVQAQTKKTFDAVARHQTRWACQKMTEQLGL